MTDKIPLVDLKAAYHRHQDGIDAAMREVIENTRFIQGQEVAEFERDFARFCGAAHAIGVGSGTAAIHLVLDALGVGPGDEVAVPSHTFIATAEPITWLGAKPRFVEVEPETGCMDPSALKSAIDGVKAVMPVHLYGRPADMAAISSIAADAGVPVVEDAAQAHGADVTGPDGTRRAGTLARAACFSFYPGKNLGAFGDAGAITTDDDELAARVAMMRDHGRTTKYEHLVVGQAHRLDTLQAAVLKVKLTTLAADNERRRALADAYSEQLAGVGDLVTPAHTPDRRGVYHLYVLRTAHRDALLAHLNERGIGAGVHYPLPVHLQPAYAALGYREGSLPATESWARQCLSLPIYPELTESQPARVVDGVRAFYSLPPLVHAGDPSRHRVPCGDPCMQDHWALRTVAGGFVVGTKKSCAYTARTPPTSGPSRYTQIFDQSSGPPDSASTSSGPNVRAGFSDAPVAGPMARTAAASARPMPSPAKPTGTRSRTARLYTALTSRKVPMISAISAPTNGTPPATCVAPRPASRPSLPNTAHSSNTATNAPTSCATT